MRIGKNPIHRLAKRVIANQCSLDRARSEADSNSFRMQVKKSHILHMFVWIPMNASDDPATAAVMWCLTILASKGRNVDEQIIAKMHWALADAYNQMGEHEEAVGALLKAREISENLSLLNDAAQCDLRLGDTWLDMIEPGESIGRYESAHRYFLATGARENSANCELGMGVALGDVGAMDQARKLLYTARRRFRHLGRELDVAKCDFNIGRLYLRSGKAQPSLRTLDRASSVFQKEGISEWFGQALFMVAKSYVKLGKVERAKRIYEKALSVFKNDKRLEVDFAQCCIDLAIILCDEGNLKRAFRLLSQARAIFFTRRLEYFVALCDYHLAALHRNWGQYHDAIRLLSSAQAAFDNDDDSHEELAHTLYMLGTVYQILGDLDTSLVFYDLAREAYAELPHSDVDLATCDRNKASIYRELDNREESLKLFTSAVTVFRSHGAREEQAVCEHNMAQLYQDLGDHDRSLKLLSSAARLFRKQGLALDLALCKMNSANAMADKGWCRRALRLYGEAMEAFQKTGMQSEYSICCHNAASIHRELGEHEMAQALYTKAVETVEDIHGAISSGRDRRNFLNARGGLYHNSIDFLLGSKDLIGALEFVERLKSRQWTEMIVQRKALPVTVDQRDRSKYARIITGLLRNDQRLLLPQSTEERSHLLSEMKRLEEEREKILVKNGLKNTVFDPRRPINNTWPEIAELTSHGHVAIIELFPMEDKIVAFIVRRIDKSGPAIAVAISRDYNLGALEDDVTALQEAYEAARDLGPNSKETSDNRLEDWRRKMDEVVGKLSATILPGLMPHLNGINTIAMIPYSWFHLLPLHAMYTLGSNGQHNYLIEHYSITYAPSARLMHSCSKRSIGKEARISVLMANPPGSEHLTWIDCEVDSVMNSYSDRQFVQRATPGHLRALNEHANVVHFVGHAASEGLYLFDDADPGRYSEKPYPLDRLVTELSIPRTSLVTLSACETGMITEVTRFSDEYIGLPAAFLIAGARSVVSSLWMIDDLPTALLMGKFHESMKMGSNPSESLRHAQLWLMNKKNRSEHENAICAWLRNKTRQSAARLSGQVGDILRRHRYDTWSHPYVWAAFTCSGGL